MMGTYAAESYGLTKVTTMRAKFCRAKDTVVRVIPLNGDTNVIGLTFEEQFTTNSIAGGSGELMVDEEKATAVVDINCTTGIPIMGGAVPRGR
jgi:hypothetical protein